MSTPAVVLFLGLLTVAAQVAVLAWGALALVGRWRRGAARPLGGVVETVTPGALPLAWLVALVASVGSLYLSEIAGFVPCKLCWYQRTAMYPLVPVLGLAAWRGDVAVRPYALALVAVGLPISAYHYLIEWLPWLESTACDPATPCSLVWVWLFGYVSIPLMTGTAFILIGLLLLAAGRERE